VGLLLALAAILGSPNLAIAQAVGTGPVATQCAAEIKQHCANKTHGAGEVRACLEAHKSDVSPACRQALDTTGGGRGRNRTQ
jgi:hypothetical protein